MFQRLRCDALVLLMLGALPGVSGAAAPPPEPQSFVLAATEAGLLEVESARVAMNASTNAAVKTYADRVLTDHGKVDAELAVMAKQKSITVPTELDAARSSALQSLRDKSIAEFDAAYVQQVLQRQARTLELFRANLANGDAELAAYAARTLPLLQEHLRLARQLQASLGKQAAAR